MPVNLTIPSVTLSKFGDIRILDPLTSLTQEEVDACIGAVLSTMKTKFVKPIDATRCVICCLCLAFPQFIEHYVAMTSIGVTVVKMSKDAVLSAFGAGMTIQEDAPEALPLMLPIDDAVFQSVQTIPVFCGLSVLMFCLGKNVDESAPSPFTDGRPNSLIGKHHLTSAQQVFFPGKQFGPTMQVINQIAYSFVEYPEVKSTTARLLLSQLVAVHTSPPMDCIMTAFKLLKGSQLAHAQAAIECVVANPWMVNIPELRPDLLVLARDLKTLNAMPEDPRWFVKLLSTDNNTIFNRQEMRRLSAVAVAWKKQTDPTFQAYKGDDTSYASLIQTFFSYAATTRREAIQGDNVAAALGLPLVDLPSPSSTSVKPKGVA